MKGRPPKPTALKLIQGTARPDRINKREPKPKAGAPACPRHLDQVAKAKWRELAPQLVTLGVLTKVDGDALAAYCEAYSRWVAATLELEAFGALTYVGDKGMIRKHPAVGIASEALGNMALYGGKLGLSPADRARVHGSQEEEAEDDDLLD